MLENYMHLVMATCLALARSTSFERRKSLEMHLIQYVDGVQKLYPDVSLTPNNHISLHIPDFLERYASSHNWQSFPAERYNGLLQKIPHSFRFGTSQGLLR